MVSLASAGTCWIRDFLQTEALSLPFYPLPGTSLIRLLQSPEDVGVTHPCRDQGGLQGSPTYE